MVKPLTYIMLTKDMELTITQAETIHQGDNLSKSITFLIPSKVADVDTVSSDIFLTYVRPDGAPDIVILERDDTMYNDEYYKYILPVTCKLSRLPGEVHMWIQIYTGNMPNPVVANSGECRVRIHRTNKPAGCFNDNQITVLYQLQKQLDSLSPSGMTEFTEEEINNMFNM